MFGFHKASEKFNAPVATPRISRERTRRILRSAARIEPLENRAMMSASLLNSVSPITKVLNPTPIFIPPVFKLSTTVDGTPGDDVINITSDTNPAYVQVSVNGAVTADLPWSGVGIFGLYVDGNGGQDVVNVGAGNVQGFAGNVYVENGAGHLTANINDASDPIGRTINHANNGSWTNITGLNGNTISYCSTQTTSASLTTGLGNDTVNIASTSAPLSVSSSGGHDTINIGNSSGLQNIFGAISISNPSNYDTVNINDTGDAYGRNVSQALTGGSSIFTAISAISTRIGPVAPPTTGLGAASTITALPISSVITRIPVATVNLKPITTIFNTPVSNVISGFSPATISYRTGDVSSVSLITGSGNNTIGAGYGNQNIYTGNGRNTVYGSNNGTDYIYGGTGPDTFVTVGDGPSHIFGGGGINSYWVDGSANQTISDSNYFTESLIGDIHKVASFAPLTVHNSNGTVSTQSVGLSGNWKNTLIEPNSGGYAYQDFSGDPLFSSSGPSQNDVNQRAAADCYFLAGIAGVAKNDTNKIMQSVVKLGDGTYAVQLFNSSHNPVFYRLTGKLPVNSLNNPRFASLGAGNSLWSALLEKAFTFARSNQGTYASIDYGGLNEPFAAMNSSSSGVWGSSATDVLTNINTALKAGKLVTAATVLHPTAGTSVVGNHVYTVESVQTTTYNLGFFSITIPTSITLRNPWGTTGPNSGTATDGGYGTLTAAQFYSDFSYAAAGYV